MLSAAVLLYGAPVFGQDSDEESGGDSSEDIGSKVEAMGESMLEMKSTLDALKKLKFSGYVQAQYQMADTVGNSLFPVGSASAGTFGSNIDNRFSVRRGRLKAAYTADYAQFVLQFDVTEKGLGIKDAYTTITDPWLRGFSLTTGVFNRPFGFEIGYSSSQRESPERARFTQTLFPGERDLGVQLGVSFDEEEGVLGMFNLRAGIFNGTGGTAVENDNNKDFIGRLGMQLPFSDIGLAVDGGVSVYSGKVTSRSALVYDFGTVSGGPGLVLDSSAANLNASFDRSYVGADLQLYYDSPLLGGVSLRGEYVTGTHPGVPSGSAVYSGSDAVVNRDVSGYYVYFVQNIGLVNQLVVKYDVFDPNTKVEGSDIGKSSNGLSAADIKYSTIGLGWIFHWNANVKFTAFYEIVKNEEVNAAATSKLVPYKSDVKDNVFTLRAQYKF